MFFHFHYYFYFCLRLFQFTISFFQGTANIKQYLVIVIFFVLYVCVMRTMIEKKIKTSIKRLSNTINKAEKEIKPNLLAPFDRKKKQDLHYILYLVLNVLRMYQTWHLPLLYPSRNLNHLFELVFYTFLANKFKIFYKILHKHLIEQKQVKHAPGSFLTVWFSVTYIKISSSKTWPINLWS